MIVFYQLPAARTATPVSRLYYALEIDAKPVEQFALLSKIKLQSSRVLDPFDDQEVLGYSNLQTCLCDEFNRVPERRRDGKTSVDPRIDGSHLVRDCYQLTIRP